MTASAPPRLVYLDWIRVAAFGLLIFYHVGMFYVTWDWHVKSDHAGHAIEPLMLFTSPWRLTLLFMVSGAATRFMADKMTAGALAGKRTMRLLVPLVFAVIVVVPPQSYYEVVEQVGYGDGFLAFLGRYLTADQSFCDADGCLILPTWNHLWFVAYLLVYTLILAFLLAWFPQSIRRLGERLAGLPAWALFLAPIAWLAAARLILGPMFELTHALVDDWYNHAMSFPAFLFGFLVMKDGRSAQAFIRLRWLALAAFLGAWAIWASYYWIVVVDGVEPAAWMPVAIRVIFAVDQWSAIVAILGFGALHLNRDAPWLRTLTVAVFPFYIAHQTIIVVAGHYLNALRLPVAIEAPLLIVVTALGCWLTFDIARRVAILRPLFGLGPQPRPAALDPAFAAR